MAAPGYNPTRSAPALAPLLVARGRLRRRRREVRVLLDFHGFLLYSPEILSAPGTRSSSGMGYGDRLVSGSRAGRSSSRRSPVPIRFVAGHRSALSSTSPFVHRAFASIAGRLPAPVMTLRSEWPQALPQSSASDLRCFPYRQSFATTRPTLAVPPLGRRA
jgi:hypothetical protein